MGNRWPFFFFWISCNLMILKYYSFMFYNPGAELEVKCVIDQQSSAVMMMLSLIELFADAVLILEGENPLI